MAFAWFTVIAAVLIVATGLFVSIFLYSSRRAFQAVLIISQLRLLYILPIFPRPCRSNGRQTSHVLIVLGSGGHTAEMLSLLRKLDPQRYTKRTYVFSSGDTLSASRATTFEDQLYLKSVTKENIVSGQGEASPGQYEIVEVPRARRIHQPLWSTPWTALQCLWACVNLLQPHGPFTEYPDLILTNGPGTGVIVVLSSIILRYFGLRGTSGKMRTIYVESWARTKTLSLSGKILIRLVDRFFVQWDTLKGMGGKAEYRGFLVQ
jgi:beta-1,4-N-acetylglucosaminyltransferase